MPEARQSGQRRTTGSLRVQRPYRAERRKFIFGTYLLAGIFVLTSLAQWVPAVLIAGLRSFFKDYQVFAVLCLFIALFAISAFVFWEGLRFTFPFNWILVLLIVECVTLGLMRAVVESLFIHFIVSLFSVTFIFSSLVAAGVFLRYDLTLHVVVLFVLTILFFVGAVLFSILAVLTDISFSILIYASFLAATVLMFVMYHAQTIQGGRYSEMRLKDVLLAALIIYLDFVILFALTIVMVRVTFDDSVPLYVQSNWNPSSTTVKTTTDPPSV